MASHPTGVRRVGPQERIRQRRDEQYARDELTAAEYRDACCASALARLT